MQPILEFFDEWTRVLEAYWVRGLGLILVSTLVAYLPARLTRNFLLTRRLYLQPPSSKLPRVGLACLDNAIWPLWSLLVAGVGFQLWSRVSPESAGDPYQLIPVLGFFLLYRILSAATRELLPPGPRRRRLRRLMLPTVFVLAALQQIGLLGTFIAWMDQPLFTLSGDPLSLLSILLAVFVFTLFLVVSRVVSDLLMDKLLPQLGFDEAVAHALGTILRYVLTFVGILVALEAVHVDLSTLKIALGALSVGIGFGLQNIVNNFVSGIMLLFERTIKKGDVIRVGAVSARVQNIGLRSSVVRTRQGHEVIVPNSDLVTNQVTNFSYQEPKVRLDIPVGVSYNADPNQLRDILIGLAEQEKRCLETPKPQVLFMGYGDSSIDFELRAWIATEWIEPQVRSDLYYAIWYALKDAGIEIPFPQRDLHVRSGKLAIEAEAGAWPRGDSSPA